MGEEEGFICKLSQVELTKIKTKENISKPQEPIRNLGKRIKWLILPLHESETDRHLIGLSG
ncbi:hypothetical protein CHR62_13320 [Pusillimonas sp. NJUB218]|nr:hypothetical protein CHR62_13320 [Pusillimonas sp. NJUB218]